MALLFSLVRLLLEVTGSLVLGKELAVVFADPSDVPVSNPADVETLPERNPLPMSAPKPVDKPLPNPDKVALPPSNAAASGLDKVEVTTAVVELPVLTKFVFDPPVLDVVTELGVLMKLLVEALVFEL